ncbi:MAG: triose-phosphate isomerase [Chloroflexota bacterium]|nr:triose-phosphate isomerase [Chloroflexota bacterium]
MRQPIIAGNWKMNKTILESAAFATELAPRLAAFTGVERIVCPPFVALAAVADVLKDTGIKVGAQNVHWEKNGAYTSEIAPNMLQGLVEYVIIGHSEVRANLAETNERVNKRTKAALESGLKPIIAVGESDAQRSASETEAVVTAQVRAALDGVTAAGMAQVVIAYEPIWAIGTGKSASAQIANEVIGGIIRPTLAALYGGAVADTVRIQYGGSVKPENMAEYMALPDVDGALVGGAALKLDDFTQLIEIAAQTKGV